MPAQVRLGSDRDSGGPRSHHALGAGAAAGLGLAFDDDGTVSHLDAGGVR